MIDDKIPEDSDLLDDAPVEKGSGKKKSKQANSEERMKTMNVQLLIPEVGLVYIFVKYVVYNWLSNIYR